MENQTGRDNIQTAVSCSLWVIKGNWLKPFPILPEEFAHLIVWILKSTT